MSQFPSTTLEGREDSISVVFKEASPSQRLQCRKLAAPPFGAPLNESDYVQLDEYLGDVPLTRDNGWRFWCLCLAGDRDQVLATCKTVHRTLFVREGDTATERQAYCIASVVTDPRYRGYGLASLLLEHVAEWMDGPGGAVASLLYTSIKEFYADRGWKALPATQTLLFDKPAELGSSRDAAAFPPTRLLAREEALGICVSDVEDVKADLANSVVSASETHVAVLPTADLADWWQERARFTSLRVHGKEPQHYGAVCESVGVWVYWYHDFRRQQVAIQRVKPPPRQTEEAHVRALASLLLDALEEARRWDIPKVLLWDLSPFTLRAIKLLSDALEIDVKTEERIGKGVPMIRWKGADDKKNVMVRSHEFYARG